MKRVVAWFFIGNVAAGGLAAAWFFRSVRQDALNLPPPGLDPWVSLDRPVPADPPGHVGYRGDLVGYEHRSSVFQHLPAEARQYLLVLANADGFLARRVGVAGEVPAAVHALDELRRQPLAVPALLEVASEGTTAARLYALCGLHAAHSGGFAGARALLLAQASEQDLPVMRGCNVSFESVPELAQSIEALCSELQIISGGGA